jgi:hypothetical protein
VASEQPGLGVQPRPEHDPSRGKGTTLLEESDYGNRVDNRSLDALRWRVALATSLFAIMPTMLLVMLLSGMADTGLETGSRLSGPVVPLLVAWPLFATGAAFGLSTKVSANRRVASSDREVPRFLQIHPVPPPSSSSAALLRQAHHQGGHDHREGVRHFSDLSGALRSGRRSLAPLGVQGDHLGRGNDH